MVDLSRRQFLARLGIAPFAASGCFSALQAAPQDYANLTDYKALVCVYLDGGCDSMSLYLPAEAQLFSAYTQARGALAVPAGKVRYAGSGEHRLGFNPALPDLADLYANRQIAVLQNVGNLARVVHPGSQPKDSTQIAESFFSHRLQSHFLHSASSGVGNRRLQTGWAGRMVDRLRESNRHDDLPLSFSVGTTSAWLEGDKSAPLVLNQQGLELLKYLDSEGGNDANRAREETLDKILQLQRSHAVKQSAVESLQHARTASRALHDILPDEDYVTTRFIATTSLAKSLKTVARMIIENAAFEMQRQVFFVRHPGWDTHVNQTRRMLPLMQDLNDSLSAFQSLLQQNSLQNAVTTFTTSEFARALGAGASGTDHGWGGPQLVMGGAVNGGRLIGRAPSYQRGGVDDVGSKGRFIPSISNIEVAAELAAWFGLTNQDIDQVLPELHNFAGQPDLRLFR